MLQKIDKTPQRDAFKTPLTHFIKQDHRMSKNYLLNEDGDKVNTILAATGFNLRKMLQRLKTEALLIFGFIRKRIWKLNLSNAISV